VSLSHDRDTRPFIQRSLEEKIHFLFRAIQEEEYRKEG